jgi:hypothetical protein
MCKILAVFVKFRTCRVKKLILMGYGIKLQRLPEIIQVPLSGGAIPVDFKLPFLRKYYGSVEFIFNFHGQSVQMLHFFGARYFKFKVRRSKATHRLQMYKWILVGG